MNILQFQVFNSLDTAVANGYEDVIKWPAEQVAADLQEYDATYQGIEPAKLVPYVREWQRSYTQRSA